MYICYCNKVTEEDVLTAIREKGAKTVKDVIKITGAMQNSNCAVNNPKGVCCYSDIVEAFNKYKESIIMKTMSIYEPAMSCETGLCGVGIDPELLRISTVLGSLKKKGIEVKRYNLNNYPQEFVKNVEINKLIMGDGVDSLPATIVDGKIVKTKKYPTNAEIIELLGVPKEYLGEEQKQEEKESGC